MPNLQDIATAFLASQQNQQPQDTGPKMITAGGRVLGRDVSGNSGIDRLGQGMNLQGLAGNYLMMQKIQKRNQFLKDVNTIMGANTDTTEKKQKLWQAITDNGGDDAGLGIKDVLAKELQSSALSTIPEGMEIVGYDQKGKPMVRKVKENIVEKKFNIEQEEKTRQQEQKSQTVKDSAQDTLNTIAEVEKGIGYFGAGSLMPGIPTLQSKKVNWESNLNKLLSSKVINVMTSMKEASKTGATGFGQLSEKELKVLQDASTALKKTLSPKDAQKYLDEIKTVANKIIQKEEASQSNKNKTKSGMRFTIER